MFRVTDMVFWGTPDEPHVEHFALDAEGWRAALAAFDGAVEYVANSYTDLARLPYSAHALTLDIVADESHLETCIDFSHVTFDEGGGSIPDALRQMPTLSNR